jgi:hypothetical protein
MLQHVQECPALDWRALWAPALWRSALGCLGLMLLLGAAVHFVPPPPAQGDLSQDFETAMLAAVDQEQDAEVLW